MADASSDADRNQIRRYAAAEAKNKFGPILDSVSHGHTVAITKYGTTKAYLVPAQEYERLRTRTPAHALNLLAERFDRMFAAMQSPEAREATDRAFHAGPEEMGHAAVELARRNLEPQPLA